MNEGVKRQGTPAMCGFSLALVAVFAALCAAMICFGVQAYRAIGEETQRLSEKRTAAGYLLSRVHTGGAIRLETKEIDGKSRCVLIFEEFIDDKAYETRLFCADGALREQFCRAELPLSGAQDGAEIALMQDFIVQKDGNLLSITLVHADDTHTALNVACMGAEGSAR